MQMDKSDFCNGNGNLVCGECVCDPGWYVCTCDIYSIIQLCISLSVSGLVEDVNVAVVIVAQQWKIVRMCINVVNTI